MGITAAEADNPEQSIPKSTNQVIYRILIFYIGSLAVLLSLMPWTRVTADTSPFVLIFHELGDTFVANALNIVVLTAALSVYNAIGLFAIAYFHNHIVLAEQCVRICDIPVFQCHFCFFQRF